MFLHQQLCFILGEKLQSCSHSRLYQGRTPKLLHQMSLSLSIEAIFE